MNKFGAPPSILVSGKHNFELIYYFSVFTENNIKDKYAYFWFIPKMIRDKYAYGYKVYATECLVLAIFTFATSAFTSSKKPATLNVKALMLPQHNL